MVTIEFSAASLTLRRLRHTAFIQFEYNLALADREQFTSWTGALRYRPPGAGCRVYSDAWSTLSGFSTCQRISITDDLHKPLEKVSSITELWHRWFETFAFCIYLSGTRVGSGSLYYQTTPLELEFNDIMLLY